MAVTDGFTFSGDGLLRARFAIDGIRSRIHDSDARLTVGWASGAKYPDGTAVGDVARWQEFGTRTIPARPFIRVAVAENQNKWVGMVRKGLLDAELSIDTLLERVGMVIVADIQRAIRNVTAPPLAKSTLRRRLKGGTSNMATATKPLIDTGLMLRSIQSRVSVGEVVDA